MNWLLYVILGLVVLMLLLAIAAVMGTAFKWLDKPTKRVRR